MLRPFHIDEDSMLESIVRDLQQPEYLHVLLNPIPIYGLAAGVIGLIVALFVPHPAAKIPPLMILFFAGLMAWPVAELGERAESRVLAVTDADGSDWLHVHEERAEKAVWLFYALAAVAAVGVAVVMKAPRRAGPVAAAVLLVALAACALGVWVAYPGGRIIHREFRTSLPPSTHEHHHE